MIKLTVGQLKAMLADWSDSAEIYIQTSHGSVMAIVAIPAIDGELEKRQGRFADAEDSIAYAIRIS